MNPTGICGFVLRVKHCLDIPSMLEEALEFTLAYTLECATPSNTTVVSIVQQQAL